MSFERKHDDHYEAIDNDYEGNWIAQQEFDNQGLTSETRVIDLEYERSQQSYKMNDAVKSFITHFFRAIQNGNIFEITHDYEYGWNLLSDQYFKNTTWPAIENIDSMLNEDESMKSIFLILYKEMYFRHIYASIQGGPSLEQRFQSYKNYVDLFNAILDAEQPLKLDLPIQWLWDIIDEFIYQFQSFCQYRAKLVKRGQNAQQQNVQEEIAQLKQAHQVWNVHSVLNVLHALVTKSNINKQLELLKQTTLSGSLIGTIDQQISSYHQDLINELANDEFAQSNLYKMLGYFSLVGLLRLNSLFGDYYLAINTMQHVDLDIHKQVLIARVPSCIITTCYYVGFAYMMMRRYEDAIKVFVDVLIYFQRTRSILQTTTRTLLNEMISKQNDQIYHLLIICLNFYPMRIDDSVHSHIKEKYSEKLAKLQRGDQDELTNIFHYACPKFLLPVGPNFNGVIDKYMEPYHQQLKVFRQEVDQQNPISDIRSFLKLYTTLPIEKLASFINKTPNELKSILLCFKHKMSNIESDQASEDFRSSSEVDFYIHKDMIHIADTKVAKRFSDYFIRQILKFDEMSRNLKMASN